MRCGVYSIAVMSITNSESVQDLLGLGMTVRIRIRVRLRVRVRVRVGPGPVRVGVTG